MSDCPPIVIVDADCNMVLEEQCSAPGLPGPPGPPGGVTGPASSTNDAIVLWNGTTGTAVKNSSTTLAMLATVMQLNTKVTQVPGMGLSEANFTNAEKIALQGLINLPPGNFVGTYPDLLSLQAAWPTAPNGAYAYVTDTGDVQQFYAWDNVNAVWLTSHQLDGAGIAALLFAEPNTNNFTDVHKSIVEDAVTQTTLDALIQTLATEIGLLTNNVVTEATTSRQLVIQDTGRYIRLTNVAGCNIIVPEQAVVNWQDAPVIRFRVATAGAITLTPGSGVTINNAAGISTVTEHDNFSLKRVNNNEWDLILTGY